MAKNKTNGELPENMTWRYQPVIMKKKAEKFVVIIEVHLDGDGKLVGWTGQYPIAPCGDDADELLRSLALMSASLAMWKPVSFDKLKAGMVLKRKYA